MATVTVTETDVVLQVTMTRDEAGADRVFLTANSITDQPLVAGRIIRDTDITADLTTGQMTVVRQVLDFLEARMKAQWSIP